MAKTSFKPTLQMAANAKRGLKLRDRFNRGGTSVGVNRANQLVARADLDEADVMSMASYFARHAVDNEAKSSKWRDASDPSVGFIAWLLWGGDAGEAWAKRNRAKIGD